MWTPLNIFLLVIAALLLLLGYRWLRWWRGSDGRAGLPGMDEEFNADTLARSRLSSGRLLAETSLAGRVRGAGSMRRLGSPPPARSDGEPLGPKARAAVRVADDDEEGGWVDAR